MNQGALFGKSLAWLSGAVYLLLIASLGLLFNQIEAFKISELEMLNAEVQTSGSEQSIVPLTFSHVLKKDRPDNKPERISLRLPFDAATDSQPLAVFIPRVSSDLQLSVNNVIVRPQSYANRVEQVNRPLLIPVPDQLVREDQANELRFDLVGFGYPIVLSQFYLGPQALLEPTYDYFFTFRHDLTRIAFTVTLMFAVFMGTIWMVRRQFNEYGWLSLSFLAFSYYLLLYMRDSQPVHFELQIWSFLLARAIFISAFVFFIHRFLRLERRRLEIAILAFFGIIFGIGLMLVLRNEYRPFLTLTYFTSLPMVLLLIGYVTALLANALRKSGHVYLHWLLVGSLLGLILGMHDLLVVFDAQHWLFRDFFISHYASVFMAIGFGGVLVHRIAHALFNSEDLNVELNRQVAQKTLQLETASQQRLEYEKEIALYAERQRIIADMHDGVGGQLVGLLAANRSGGLEQNVINHELDQILADLRLVLDALTPAGEELLAALARLKERYAQVLGNADCQLNWRIDPKIETIPMQPSQTINILRLIQEAVQNTLKHAHAKNISISLAAIDDGYELAITDDGIGMAAERLQSGQGFGSQTMQQRARAVGAELEIRSPATGGTTVRLRFSTLSSAR